MKSTITFFMKRGLIGVMLFGVSRVMAGCPWDESAKSTP
jgi:hypothetical protein